MFLPIGNDLRLRRPTVVNHGIIAVNLAVFVSMLAYLARDEDRFGAFVQAWGLKWVPHEWWRFATYSVIHDGGWHVFGNMLMLWVFGPAVEDRLGRLGYLGLYLAGMLGAAFAHVATSPYPAVGASGAVAAVTGAFVVLFPMLNVRTLVVFFVIGIFNIPAMWFIGAAIVKDFLMTGFGGGSDEVARTAHLGGYAVGIATAFTLQLTRVVPHEQFDLLSLIRHAKRRSELRQAVRSAEQERSNRLSPVSAGDGRLDPAREEQLAAARAMAAQAIARDDLPEAAGAYRRLLDLHRSTPGAAPTLAVLSRRHQTQLGNWFFARAEYASAMTAYEGFSAAYPSDPETPRVRLMMALMAARYLGRPDEARRIIESILPALHDPDQVSLAKDLLSELPAGSAH